MAYAVKGKIWTDDYKLMCHLYENPPILLMPKNRPYPQVFPTDIQAYRPHPNRLLKDGVKYDAIIEINESGHIDNIYVEKSKLAKVR
jgi:hypothetical protein